MKQLYLGHRVATDTAWLAAAFSSVGSVGPGAALLPASSPPWHCATARMLQGWDVNRRTCVFRVL